jgi:hypothetical protein
MALPNTNIPVGTPPLLWSDVKDAFDKINENFIALDLATGGTAVNLETLNTSVSPVIDNEYTLGTSANKWASVYTSDYSATPGNEFNGVWLGTAQIRGISGIVELPAGSTVNGDLIIDPNKTFFKSVQVDNGNQVVASSFIDILNLNSGTAMQLVVDSAAESITFNNAGVTSAIAGSGISVNSATGAVTFTNSGVTSVTNGSILPSGRAAGAGIAASTSTGNTTLTNTGVLAVQAGFGISVNTDAATGIAQVSFNPTTTPATAFTNVTVTGQPVVIASDSISDTLTFTAGYGMTIIPAEPDTVTFSVNPRHDIIGSVFGDDSTTLVDGVNGYLYGNVVASTLRTTDSRVTIGQGAGGDGLQGLESIAIGQSAGGFTQGDYAVAIGSGAGNIGQGNRAVAIGATAGVDSGDYAISIGNGAGYPTAVSSSIAINASGFTLDAPAAGFYVRPIRSTANGRPLMYNTSTYELFSSNVLEFIGSTISTSDSSGITVDVLTTFNSDVNVENELRVRGSLMISVAQLKSIAAASADFTAFKAAIAALTA